MQATPVTAVPEGDAHEQDAMAQLAQVLAHRLRGLVAGIEGFTDLLTDSLETPDQRDLALKILEGTARIESVLADLQLYGELLQPIMLPVRLDELLSELLAPLSDAEQERVALRMAPDAAAHMLDADPFLIRQALLILIRNALEATARAGLVEMHARTTPDGGAELSLRNDGFIDVDDAERVVFAPFFTTKAQNLGVGLTIARRIVRLHGGSLDLTHNSVEEGVRFTLLLPPPEWSAEP